MEKYLKARLQEANLSIEKTHNLSRLLDLVLPVEPNWAGLRPDLLALTTYSVSFRYPGDSAGQTEAREAVRLAAGSGYPSAALLDFQSSATWKLRGFFGSYQDGDLERMIRVG